MSVVQNCREYPGSAVVGPTLGSAVAGAPALRNAPGLTWRTSWTKPLTSLHMMLAVCSAVTLLGARSVSATDKIPVILSTDVGNEIDDQWAVAYMLVNPQFDVLGIISAHAPTLPPPSAHTTYLVLHDEVENRLGQSSHPPLFEGSSVPLQPTRRSRHC